MQLGDTVKFEFGKLKEKKEGRVVKIFEKTIYLRVDFPNQKNKLIKRKKHTLES